MLNQKVHILTIHIHSINKNEKDTKNAVKIKKMFYICYKCDGCACAYKIQLKYLPL